MEISESSTTSILAVNNSQENNGDDTDNDVEEIVSSKRGNAKVYDDYATYTNYKEFIESLDNGLIDNNQWIKKDKRNTKNGEKQFYKCSLCSKMMFSLKLSTSLQVSVNLQDIVHEHGDQISKEAWEKSKKKAVQLYQKDKKTPKEIARWLRLNLGDGYVELSQIQITNLIQRVKRQEEPIMTVEKLKSWCESHSAIPDNPDEMFVVSEFKITPEELSFNIFFTTIHLISFTNNCNHVATDATYKLLWLNFPVLLCGTTDKKNSFHPFGILLTRYETESEFAFMFQTVKRLSQDLHNIEFSPTILLADAAGAITNGFKSVFSLDKRIVCWAHVERKIEEHLKGVDKLIKKKVKADFCSIQVGVQHRHFKTAIQLLEAKWRAINDVNLNQFFEYFNEQWMGQYTIGWYESYAEGYPSTNNALESTNKTIKDDGTNRDRLSLNDFMTCMGNLLYEWSHDRDFSFQTTRKFELKPIIETKEWTFGYSWLKLKKRLVKFTHDNILFYMCTSSNCTFDITKTRCKEYWSQNDGWYDFEEFIKWSNEVKAIKIDIDDWQLSTCSCEYWKKHLKCKHVIGISFILKLNEFPGLDLAIEGNAKRGRKKKANPSLERNSIAPINNQFINQSSATNLIDNENLQRPVLSSISIQNEQINENHSIFVSNGIASSNNDQVIVTQAPVESTSNNFRAPEKRGRGRPKKNKENDANLITENQTNDENSNQSARLSKRRKS